MLRVSSVKRPDQSLVGAIQVRIVALVLLLYVIDGIDTQILSVSVAAMARDWHVPVSAFGTAMAAGYAGAAAGAMIGGVLGDRWGRKPTTVLGAILFGTTTVLLAFLKSPNEVAFARCFAGLGLGGCLPPCLALLTECMPRARHGLVISLAILCHPLGLALTGLAAATLLPSPGWQVMFICAGLLPLLAAGLLIVALPESPAWLSRNFARRAATTEPPQFSKPAALTGIARHFHDIFARPCRARTIGLLAGFFFTYLAMTMVLSWLPSLLVNTGYSQKAAGTALFIWSIAGVAGIFCAGLLTGRYRTSTVLASHLGGAFGVLAVVTFSYPAAIGGSLPAWFNFLLAIGGFMMNAAMTSLYTLAANSFASDIRASGIGLSATLGRIGSIIGALLGAQALGMLGAKGFFLIATAAVLLAFVWLQISGSARFSRHLPHPLPAE